MTDTVYTGTILAAGLWMFASFTLELLLVPIGGLIGFSLRRRIGRIRRVVRRTR